MTLYQCYRILVKPNIISMMVSQLGFLALPPIPAVNFQFFRFCVLFSFLYGKINKLEINLKLVS